LASDWNGDGVTELISTAFASRSFAVAAEVARHLAAAGGVSDMDGVGR
jgi:hypothetical protein